MTVVAAVIEESGLFLACRRNADRAAGGKWEFPGGKQEIGETPRETIERELQEELGVTSRARGELSTNETPVGNQVIRLVCMSVDLLSSRPNSSTDHDLLRWVTADELETLDWADPDWPIVRKLAVGR